MRPLYLGTTVHDNFGTIKIVIKRLDFSVLIAPQNDAKPVVSASVILRNCFAPHFPTYRHNYKHGSVL